MSIFSFANKSTETILVYHDDALQVLQFEYSKEAIAMIGFNELALTPGIIENGKILSLDSFGTVLGDLLTQATPRSISTKELYVNIPYALLYSFVEDSSHKAGDAAMRASILEAVRGHYPMPIEDLELTYDSAEKEHEISYAAYASPKKWQQRFKKVCAKLGISAVKFVPESICLMALYEEPMREDAALFSCHGAKVYLSLFHNGLLYDSYFLGSVGEENLKESVNYSFEFLGAQKDFMARFNTSMQKIFFVGFDKKYHKSIRASLNETKEPIIFVEPKHSKLRQFLPYEMDKSTLFGLFEIASSETNTILRK